MSILKKNDKKFYTLFIDGNSCKICFRNLSPKRVVLEEKNKEIEIKDDTCIDEINDFIQKDGYVCVLQSSLNQGLSKGEIIDDGLSLVNKIDGDIISFLDLGVVNGLRESFGFKIDEFISPFKVLYYLYKNSNLTTTSLFVLKFYDSLAVMVANEKSVLDGKMLDLNNF